MYVKNKNLIKSKKGISLLVTAILVVFAGSAYGYVRIHDSSNSKTGSSTKTTGTTSTSKNKVDYSPATKQEQQEADAKKDEIVKQQSSQHTNTSANVTPVITYANQDPATKEVEVDGFVSGVIEEGGTCRLTAIQGNNTVTKDTTGHRNAQNTICEPFRLARTEFNTTGDWTFKITYISSSANGTSQTKVVKVQ